MYIFVSVHASSTDKANVQVIECKNAQTVSTTDKATLKSNGFDKCAEPFGILIAGSKKITKKSVLAMAKVVAELLDQNKDGKIQDNILNMKKELTYNNTIGYFLSFMVANIILF